MTPGRGRRLALSLALSLLAAGGLPGGATASSEPLVEGEPIREGKPVVRVAPLDAAWFAPAVGLEERVTRTRLAADELGLLDLDAFARALLLDPELGSALERSLGATRLAPGLPAAHAALAAAQLADGDLRAAFAAALAALTRLPRHLEASLWLGANVLAMLTWALALAALAFMALVAAKVGAPAAHDLGDALEPSMPGFARAALLGTLLLTPAAAGEGALGAGLALFALGFCYGRGRERVALAAAASLLAFGLHPVAELAGRFLAAPGSDPIVEAAYATENGVPGPLDLARLEYGARSDPLARGALALEARRAGAWREADVHYRALIESGTPTARLLNNAANARLHLGDTNGAIALYRRAATQADSALIWFNLAQAYGRMIRVDEHEAALAEAQRLDESIVRELTQRLSRSPAALVADVPLATAEVRRHLLEVSPGASSATVLRRPLAPGRLGAGPRTSAGAFAAAGVLAWALGASFRRSRGCRRCGARLCPRCRTHATVADLCEGCARLLHRPDTIDPTLRGGRLDALQRRSRRRARLHRAVALVVPGAAGVVAGRPLLGLTALVFFCAALAALLGRNGLVPDPLAAGQAGPLCLGGAGVGLALAYLVVTAGLVLLLRRSAP